MERALFIVKRGQDVSGGYSYSGAFGLTNSAFFVVNTLREAGVKAKLVVVNDNNDIDKEVTTYRPSHVFIEALWVVPEKFQVLRNLHPNVKWVVRIHSDIPFLAHEGIAIDWIKRY